jgi:hypothetical protein
MKNLQQKITKAHSIGAYSRDGTLPAFRIDKKSQLP